MTKIQLEVIPEPDAGSNTILQITKEGKPYFSSDGDTDYVCGACGNVLAAGVTQGSLVDLVLKCRDCESYNKVRGT